MDTSNQARTRTEIRERPGQPCKGQHSPHPCMLWRIHDIILLSIVVLDARQGGIMQRPRRIAIDGPAGSGKSTIGEQLARRLGYLYIDTGAMYRAVAWLALQNGVDINDGPALARLAQDAGIEISHPNIEDG